MIVAGTVDQAHANRRKLTLANGTDYWKSELITSPAEHRPSPQAFLVEQAPDSVILPHFHLEDEFQVVVRGDGSFGRHPVRAFIVHYAGAHTGYGPITAGRDGLWYFTLRQTMDVGAQFLPEARDRMQRVAKRHLLGAPVEASDVGALGARSAPSTETVIDQQADGIAAWMLRVPPASALKAPAHSGSGRFYLVISGAIRTNGTLLPALASVFASPEEAALEVEAGPQGAEVLVLQFPPGVAAAH